MTGLGHIFGPLVFRPARRDLLRFSLTISGIAAGVATVAAIRLANASVLSSFEGTVDFVAGRASLTVLAEGPGVPEETLERLAWLRARGAALVPALQATAAEPGPAGDVVEVLGIDPISDPAARDSSVAGGTRASLPPIFERDTVLVTEPFASRRGLGRGGTLALVANGRERSLRVVGILPTRGAARAASESMVFADLATVQEAFGRTGLLDRIDIVLPPGTGEQERERIAEEIRNSLPPGTSVGPPERRNATVDRMLRAFRVNLSALGLIALLVGTYFVYNTLSISVLRRRADIGTVRALGASRRSVFAAFLLEGTLLGLAGSVLGTAGGVALARGALAAVGRTATEFYLPSARPTLHVDPLTIALSIGAGVLASVLSALAPALEAARVAPAATMRHGSVEAARRRTTRPLAAIGAGLLVLAALATRLPPVSGLPVFGFVSVFFVFAGTALATPLAVWVTARASDRTAVRLLGPEARIARANLTGSLSRTAVAVAALSMAISLVVAVAVMVGSFRSTVSAWVGQTLRADLFVTPAGGRGRALGGLPQEVVDLLAAVPGVRAVDPYLKFEATRGDLSYTVSSGRFEVLAALGNLPLADGRDARAVLRSARDRGEALISEPLAEKLALRPGDVLELPARSGLVPVRIAGVYTDYSSDRGTATVDRELFRELFRLDGATSVSLYLDPTVPAQTVRRRILEAVRGRFALRVQTSSVLREAALAMFDRTFAVTWALEAIAVSVALLGVFNTLMALVLERRREIGLLRLLGASVARVRRAVRYEAAGMAFLAGVLGVLSGGAMAYVLIHVINRQSFGWTIQTHVPWALLAGTLALVALATLGAAHAPARLAAATDAAAVLKEE